MRGSKSSKMAVFSASLVILAFVAACGKQKRSVPLNKVQADEQNNTGGPGQKSGDVPLSSFKSATGSVNLMCTGKTSQARMESLLLNLEIGEQLIGLEYTMDKDDWFSKEAERKLVPKNKNDSLSESYEVKAICLDAKCDAIEFSMKPKAGDSEEVFGKFYGVPEPTCAKDKETDARPMKISTDKPKDSEKESSEDKEGEEDGQEKDSKDAEETPKGQEEDQEEFESEIY